VLRRLGSFVAGLIVVGVVSLLGAGFAAHVTYLDVARATATTGLSPFSPGDLARMAGFPDPIPSLVPTTLLLGGTVVAWILAGRGRPAAGFCVAVVAWTFGSPVVNINTPTLLLALLAPVAWPWRTGGGVASGVASGAPWPGSQAQGSREIGVAPQGGGHEALHEEA